MVVTDIQGVKKSKDTTTTIKASKLFPAKITSDEGAIIPKEATEMIVLQPSFPREKENTFLENNYPWIAAVFLLVIIASFLYLRRIRRKTKS